MSSVRASMPMKIVIPDEIARAAEEMAAASGTTAEAVLLNALQAHFPPISDGLSEEFRAWERASDEDMARLEDQDDSRRS